MTKLFKNSKQVLAFVFAFAVLAVSLFTGNIAIEADACDVSKIDYWDGTAKAINTTAHAGTEADPYIIENAEQLAYVALQRTSSELYTGKFFKMSDNIDVLVLQPEGVVNLETLMALDSAEAVKDYLTSLSGVKNWLSVFWGASFNGSFDGNNVTIYGLYADGIAANKDDVGLFPQFDGGYKDGNGNVIGNYCKNIAVKNSYFNTRRRVGAISGASYGTGYGAKIDGIIYYDTIEVVNCYITAVGNQNFYNEQAVVADGGSNDVSIFNNILVRGNYAYNTEIGKHLGVAAANNNNGAKDSNGEMVKGKLSNSIILGTDPFRRDLYSDMVFYNVKEGDKTVRTFFNNVITDSEAGKVTVANPSGWGSPSTTAEFTEENIRQVTATGFGFQNATVDNLDWTNTWFMSEDGPELRAFHGEFKYEETATTHVWYCEDCGLKSYGGVANHDWIEQSEGEFVCSVCDYRCLHNSLDTYDDPGNCIVDPGVYTVCNYCSYTTVIPAGKAPGHDLTHVEAYPGHCQEEGHDEYWECSVCNNKFTSDDAFAAFESAVNDAALNTGIGSHIKDKNDDGTIVMHDETGHWYICKIDGGRLDHKSNAIADDEVVAHNYYNAECVECGYKCENHNFVDTGKIVVNGTCYDDEKVEYKCDICGYKVAVVTVEAGHKISYNAEVKPTDKMEGTKAHYSCSECKSIFGDAEGKNSVTRTSLIIPKVLPAEYQNSINADQSNKSPSTSDNFASVIAVATLAGAALVIARKVKA